MKGWHYIAADLAYDDDWTLRAFDWDDFKHWLLAWSRA